MTSPEGCQLRYTKRAKKDIDNLDKSLKKRLGVSLERFKLDPTRYSIQLTDAKVAGMRRFRVGDYRVLFELNEKIITVVRVAHRREVYDR